MWQMTKVGINRVYPRGKSDLPDRKNGYTLEENRAYPICGIHKTKKHTKNVFLFGSSLNLH